MFFEILANYSVMEWFTDATHELIRYFDTMSATQWGIVSAASVAFGFLCLRGNPVNR